MNFYRATLIFNDNQQLNVDMNEEDLEKFSDNISNYKIFWDKEQNHGFWTDIKNIRYISFNKQDKAKNELPRQADSKNKAEAPRKTKRASKSKTGNASR